MKTIAGLDKNFQLLVLEVIKQVEDTQEVIGRMSPRLMERIQRRDDYIDILNTAIEKTCFEWIRNTRDLPQRTLNMVRAVDIVATNLERIADKCESIVGQLTHYRDPNFLARYDFGTCFAELLAALRTTVKALSDRDTGLALKICQSEEALDAIYAQVFGRVLASLEAGEPPGDLLTTLMIFHYLERMGDAMENVGEAILFAARGEKIKLRQYLSLDQTLAKGPMHSEIEAVELRSPWVTRSGVAIGEVTEKEGDKQRPDYIYKGGSPEKLLKEKKGLERWEEVLPGLPPRIQEFDQSAGQATLLLSFLEGSTFQEILLGDTEAMVAASSASLRETLRLLWARTRRPNPIQTGFIGQLEARLKDVFQVHPKFRPKEFWIGPYHPPTIAELIAAVRPLEAELPAPFAVLIHGDFNLDNVIFNPKSGRIHFIDLHRTREADYVQDIAVHLASIFRLPTFEASARQRINAVSRDFLRFARSYAESQGDATFQARLALGLARALYTSTRFEFDAHFAGAMRLRAMYLLRKIALHKGRPWNEFRFPDQVLVYWRRNRGKE